MKTKPTLIHITDQHTVRPGPAISFNIDKDGTINFAKMSSQKLWANMQVVIDAENNIYSPLALSEKGVAPHYEEHWPVIIKAEKSKRMAKELVTLVSKGKGHWMGPPSETDGRSKPVAFYLIDKAISLNIKDNEIISALLRHDYTDLSHLKENLLDRAIMMRLFNVADALWEHGYRPSENCVNSGYLMEQLSSPFILGEENNLQAVAERLAGNIPQPPGKKNDKDLWDQDYLNAKKEWHSRAADKIINQTRVWAERLDECGTPWTFSHKLTIQDTNKTENVKLSWLATIHYTSFQNYNKVRSQEITLDFNDEQKKKWVALWESFQDKLSSKDIMENVYHLDNQDLNLVTILQRIGQPELAAQLETRALLDLHETPINGAAHRKNLRL